VLRKHALGNKERIVYSAEVGFIGITQLLSERITPPSAS
jgi:hypothetical protein